MKAIRCECGCIYPDDMSECPSCHCSTESNYSHVLTEAKTFGARKSNQATWKPIQTTPNNPKMTACTACKNQISIQAESCPHCGHPTGVHVCPSCGGSKTKVISGASKATSIFLWGPFAANKVLSKYQCKDCGHKF